MSSPSCDCNSQAQRQNLVFACCGSADVGAIADLAARELNRTGAGKMFCTVGLGGRVPAIMATTAAAASILAIDGCPLQCVKCALEQAGFSACNHLKLWEMGLKKGETPVTTETISRVVAAAKPLLPSQGNATHA